MRATRPSRACQARTGRGTAGGIIEHPTSAVRARRDGETGSLVKHVTYGEKSLLMSDASAEALIGYAVALGAENTADTVTLSAIGVEGNEVTVTFLLNPATALVVASASAHADPPANEEAVTRILDRTARLRRPPPPQPYAFDHEIPGDFR